MAVENKLVTCDLARELLDYNPVTGVLTWRQRARRHFKTDRSAKIWNTCYSGRLAGSPDHYGYTLITIFNKKYKAHRLVWLIHFWHWPINEIDHINGDPSDNRLHNLRDVSHIENNKNKRRHSNNKTGHTGVRIFKHGKYGAHIDVDGKHIFLGSFDTLEDAVAARKAGNIKHGFHENHGART